MQVGDHDPRSWSQSGSWTVESPREALDRAPGFGQGFFARVFDEFPNLAATTEFLRWSEQPDNVYAVVELPAGGVGVQIDPDIGVIIVRGRGGQAEYGDWGSDQVSPAVDHIRRLAADLPPSPRPRMTIDQFLALPEDGIDRMLLDGEIWELGQMIKDRLHGTTAATLVHVLGNWQRLQPKPRGSLHCSNVGFRLDDGSVVGIDLALASPELVAQTSPETSIFQGPPLLTVEILSPFDRLGPLVAKIRKYMQAGVVVWEIDPACRLVRVHRPGLPVESSNETQELVGDPYLPGSRVAVAEFFGD